MKIAIVKPDHIGDLVLSSPAVRAIAARFSNTTLFVASKNLSLARFLFGDIELRALDMPHLSKGGHSKATSIRFKDYDVVVFLRRDDLLSPERLGPLCNEFLFYTGNHNFHQSLLDYTIASWLVGDYDIDREFYGTQMERVLQKSLTAPKAVGLCVGAGYYANCWPPIYWIQLGKTLQERGHEIRVIYGPSEGDVAGLIARALGLKGSSMIAGSDDFADFIAAVSQLDWIVAGDGGTAHLCSLVTPVLSFFGGSPFRRYAPFGRSNRLLTLELPCSPCSQYASRSINGCLSNECIVGIEPALMKDALYAPFWRIDRPRTVELRPGCWLYLGVSHLDREDFEIPMMSVT